MPIWPRRHPILCAALAILARPPRSHQILPHLARSRQILRNPPKSIFSRQIYSVSARGFAGFQHKRMSTPVNMRLCCLMITIKPVGTRRHPMSLPSIVRRRHSGRNKRWSESRDGRSINRSPQICPDLANIMPKSKFLHFRRRLSHSMRNELTKNMHPPI